MTEKEVLNLIQEDRLMMRVLKIADGLNLPDWLIGSGFVRNKVWNHLSGRNVDGIDATDIDLVYLDPVFNNEERDRILGERLNDETGLEWEIKNNAYKYKSNERSEYNSAKVWAITKRSLGWQDSSDWTNIYP